MSEFLTIPDWKNKHNFDLVVLKGNYLSCTSLFPFPPGQTTNMAMSQLWPCRQEQCIRAGFLIMVSREFTKKIYIFEGWFSQFSQAWLLYVGKKLINHTRWFICSLPERIYLFSPRTGWEEMVEFCVEGNLFFELSHESGLPSQFRPTRLVLSEKRNSVN